jgi:hypothetical protein
MRTFCLCWLKMSTGKLCLTSVSELIPWLLALALLILFLAIVEWSLDKFIELVTEKFSKYFGHLLTKNVLRFLVALLFAIAASIWWFGGVKTGAFR